MFGKSRKTYITPAGQYYNLFANMLKQTHLLVAGTTGSGKSVVVNGIILTALYSSPNEYNFILIDPKRVELCEYKNIPHCLAYASEKDDIVHALNYAMNIIETRYKAMQKAGQKKYTGSHVYVIIDELADLLTTDKKRVFPLLQRIAQVGRAASVHLIACTQTPIAKILCTELKVNFDSRIALRTRSKQDSRNIMDCSGCELLPRYGQGYYITPEQFTLYSIPCYTEQEKKRILNHWLKQTA